MFVQSFHDFGTRVSSAAVTPGIALSDSTARYVVFDPKNGLVPATRYMLVLSRKVAGSVTCGVGESDVGALGGRVIHSRTLSHVYYWRSFARTKLAEGLPPSLECA